MDILTVIFVISFAIVFIFLGLAIGINHYKSKQPKPLGTVVATDDDYFYIQLDDETSKQELMNYDNEVILFRFKDERVKNK